MTDRQIIFSAPMVRALLDGRKTQTRRILKKPSWAQSEGWPEKVMDEQELNGTLSWFAKETGCLARLPIPQPGDRLYVREAHKLIDRHCDYRADWPQGRQHLFKWRPSIHMPRWASRLTLTVTDVRVQRLQEISEADAVAEGWPGFTAAGGWKADAWFRILWTSLHGPDAWDANPWVVAISFTVQRGNIDQIGGAA